MNFTDIYEAYSKMVYNLALQYVQNAQDAEEITQDVFVAVHQSLKSFAGKSEISTWIYRIAINKSLDWIKLKRRKKRFAVFTGIFTDNKNENRPELFSFDHPGILYEQKENMKRIFEMI